MPIESTDILPFWQWLPQAAFTWCVVVGVVAAVAMAFGLLFAVLRAGPAQGVRNFATALLECVKDLVFMSPRRILALAQLTFKESIRRRVVIVFIVFCILILFAGWFLDPTSDYPARLYLSFVLTATDYLLIALVLFLSALSLPGDISNHTIQTIVTKPVRASEIVAGRICGLAAIGTVLLALMGVVSYGFVQRGLQHTHQLSVADIESVEKAWAKAAEDGKAPEPVTVRTTEVNDHRHDVTLVPGDDPAGEGSAKTTSQHDHWHELTYRIDGAQGSAPKVSASLGGPRGMLIARRPVFGKLAFRDRSGHDAEKGVSVGDEWTYRSYIQGGSLAAAIWTFDVSPSQFPTGLSLELNLGVFRTYKGDIEQGVPGSLVIRNPKTGLVTKPRNFESQEFVTMQMFIPRKLEAESGPVDLFDDLSDNGRFEICLSCIAPQQYFGAAQADLYLRASDASFAMNFFKGYLGIWMQMTLVILYGVLFSTFLSGPIAMLATGGAMMFQIFSTQVQELASHKIIGGGPIESAWRLVTQQNMVVDVPEGVQFSLIKGVDSVLEEAVGAVWSIIPDFSLFNFSDFVAYGFDISAGDPVPKCLLRLVAYLIPVFIAGYFFFKTREVAQ